MTACISPDTVSSDVFRPRWKESESLEMYLRRVYPQSLPRSQDDAPVRVSKLSAGYLTKYANVSIWWTDRLNNHLMLKTRIAEGRNLRKAVYIFRHPAFIKASLDALALNNPDLTQTWAEALAL
jgi:hypothetical protein